MVEKTGAGNRAGLPHLLAVALVARLVRPAELVLQAFQVVRVADLGAGLPDGAGLDLAKLWRLLRQARRGAAGLALVRR